jgi:hypothetical protein
VGASLIFLALRRAPRRRATRRSSSRRNSTQSPEREPMIKLECSVRTDGMCRVALTDSSGREIAAGGSTEDMRDAAAWAMRNLRKNFDAAVDVLHRSGLVTP